MNQTKDPEAGAFEAPISTVAPGVPATPISPAGSVGAIGDTESAQSAPAVDTAVSPQADGMTPPPEPAERIIGRLEGEVGVLVADVKNLRQQLDALRKGVDKPKGRLERLSAILALVALVFSLVKFPSEFIAGYITKTKTTLFPVDQITLQYDAASRVVAVTWKVDARNDGSKLDQIEIADARIVIPPDGRINKQAINLLLFDNQSSGFRSLDTAETVPVRERVFLKEHESGSYFCILNQHATAEQIGELTGGVSSRRCLQLQFRGTDHVYAPLRGCFDFLSDDAAAILHGESFPIKLDDSFSDNT